MRKLFMVCLFVSFQESYGRKYLPKDFPVCKRFDKDLNKCILDATDLARPMIANGIPELNLPPFDPFFFSQVVIEQGTKALNFKATLKKVLIHGLSNYTCTKFDYDVNQLLFDSECSFSRLWMEGDYDIEGKIIAAPISGSGNFSATMENCGVNITEQAKIETRKGEEFLVATQTNTSVYVERPSGHLDGLFGGDKQLGDLMNKILNDNADEFFKEMVPIIEDLIKNMLENVLFKAFSKVPYDKLFPK